MPDTAEVNNAINLQQYQLAFSGSPAEKYIRSRGISQTTLDKFQLGYCWEAPDFGEKLATLDALVIPTSSNSYITRKLDPNCAHATRYANSSGESHLFNEDALCTATQPVFIVEGAIDAMSILDCGGAAVALNSVSSINKLLQIMDKDRPIQNMIIAMDADEAGKKAAAGLAAGLARLAIPYHILSDWNGCKDANELLLRDRAVLEKLISKSVESAKQAQPEMSEKDKALLDMFIANRMDNCIPTMLEKIAENANKPHVLTGFPTLDNELGGGIAPGLYLIAAMSSLGKTTFTIQMAAELAKQGQDILFFTLEMSRLDLFAKNISRHTFTLDTKQHAKFGLSTNDVLSGAVLRSGKLDLKAHFQKAVSEYSQYADRLVVVEGFADVGITQVRQITEDYIRLTGRKPVVVIDYIQLLQPADTRFTDKQNMDFAVKGLKQLVAQGVTVLAISSLNRQSYQTVTSLGSLKETGNLEYAAEVVIAIDFAAMYQAHYGGDSKDFDLNAEKERNPRDVVLTVLKNRNGRTGGQIPMAFYPKYNYFAEKQ